MTVVSAMPLRGNSSLTDDIHACGLMYTSDFIGYYRCSLTTLTLVHLVSRSTSVSLKQIYSTAASNFRSVLNLKIILMASFQNRSSILLRPRRVTATGVVVASTLETEHGREEARVAAKREARLNREAQMAARVWGGPEERAQLAAKEKAVFDKHLEAKRLVDQHEREASQNLDNHVQDYLQQQRAAELAREAAKREYQAKLRDENFRVCAR